MRKNRITVIILWIAVLLSLFMSFTYGLHIIKLKGNFYTEGVDVSIDAEETHKLIAPGMTVPYAPVITYRGIDAYIRFKTDISNSVLSIENFKGLSDKWVKRGDYYYYIEPVSHGAEIDTFESFHVPEEWNEREPDSFMNSRFTITSLCDAVQAENFSPDYTSENPWGDLIIQDNTYMGSSYEEYEKSDSAPINLYFKNQGKYSLNSELLSNNSLKPGSTFSNEIVIYNESDRNMEVFFSADKISSQEKQNLGEILCLHMTIDGKEFYNGNLRAEELVNWKSLVVMEKGTSHKLKYEIYLPSEADNSYEEKEQNYVWNLMARDVDSTPETGDSAMLIFWLIAGSIAASGLAVLKERKKA